MLYFTFVKYDRSDAKKLINFTLGLNTVHVLMD